MPDEYRQAVVVIHGIGEQRPMDTLRGFVQSVLGDSNQYFGKPDRISESLELYRLSAHPKHGTPRTDFYELYWAHLMEGTAWEHVAAWVGVLLLRPPDVVPERLKALWWATWALAIAGVVVAAVLALTPALLLSLGILGSLAIWLLRLLGGSFGLHYVGDAARYLSAVPGNIAVRHAVRNTALALLRGLHANPYHPTQHYDRIIVVGHSLGSVIAYDALRYLWQEVHSYPGAMPPGTAETWHAWSPSDVDLQQPALARMRELIQTGEAKSSDEYGRLQRELWDEQRRLGIRWKVTDLVTLGSPLTYADYLMADDTVDLDNRRRDREYPTCPPQPEDRRDAGLLTKSARFGELTADVRVLHHAALFACTRWTNLYYPGDIIGGPVKPHFGDQVRDCPLAGVEGLSSHVRYWQGAGKDAISEIQAVLRA